MRKFITILVIALILLGAFGAFKLIKAKVTTPTVTKIDPTTSIPGKATPATPGSNTTNSGGSLPEPPKTQVFDLIQDNTGMKPGPGFTGGIAMGKPEGSRSWSMNSGGYLCTYGSAGGAHGQGVHVYADYQDLPDDFLSTFWAKFSRGPVVLDIRK